MEPYPLLANRLLFSSEAIGVTMAVGRTAGYHLCAQTTGGINRAPAQGLLDHDTNVFALNTFREGLAVADRSEETAGRGRNSRNLPCVILNRSNAGRPPADSDRTQKLKSHYLRAGRGRLWPPSVPADWAVAWDAISLQIEPKQRQARIKLSQA